MKLKEEICVLERDIADLKIRLETMRTTIIGIDRELDSLHIFYDSLCYNISLLKKKKIVTIVAEYRKSKHDLQKTKNEINSLLNTRKELADTYGRTEKILQAKKARYDLLTTPKDNVYSIQLGNKK